MLVGLSGPWFVVFCSYRKVAYIAGRDIPFMLGVVCEAEQRARERERQRDRVRESEITCTPYNGWLKADILTEVLTKLNRNTFLFCFYFTFFLTFFLPGLCFLRVSLKIFFS